MISVLLALTPLIDVSRDRAAMLEGVGAVEQLGVPGRLALVGEGAFAVVVGADPPAPFVAAARFGKGRVVAFGHNAYIGPNPETAPGAARLFQNALSWLGADEGGEVAVIGGDRRLDETLSELGYRVIDKAAAPSGASVLIWREGAALGPADRKALIDAVADGTGLMTGVCPWGWAQVHRGASLRLELPQHEVLGPMGLAFTHGTVTAASGFGVGELPGELSAFAGFAALTAGEEPERIDLLEAGLRAAPPSAAPFWEAVDAALGKRANLRPPSSRSPLRREDVADRLAVTRATLDWGELGADEVPAAPGAEIFPGAAETAELGGVERTHAIDPPGWRSTGFYAAPGEPVRLEVVGPTRWRLRVGAHRDGLWHKDAWKRWPEITAEFDLVEGHNAIASPFGGPLYLIPPRNGAPLVVRWHAAARAPHFRNGQWVHGDSKEAPWAELEGEHVVLTVPAPAALAIEDPAGLMAYWDEVLVAHCRLGAEPVPARKERFVADVQISAGYMHSGYPIMTHLDVVTPGAGRPGKELDLKLLKRDGSWGHFHELGHNRQKGAWTFGGTGEVTCNLFSLNAAELLCGIEPWDHPWLAGNRDAAREYLRAPDFDGVWRKRPGLALMSYAELQREFGWEPFREAFAGYHGRPAPRGDDDKIATWIRSISVACERDLRPFFEGWGFPIAPTLKADAELGALQPWDGSKRRW